MRTQLKNFNKFEEELQALKEHKIGESEIVKDTLGYMVECLAKQDGQTLYTLGKYVNKVYDNRYVCNNTVYIGTGCFLEGVEAVKDLEQGEHYVSLMDLCNLQTDTFEVYTSECIRDNYVHVRFRSKNTFSVSRFLFDVVTGICDLGIPQEQREYIKQFMLENNGQYMNSVVSDVPIDYILENYLAENRYIVNVTSGRYNELQVEHLRDLVKTLAEYREDDTYMELLRCKLLRCLRLNTICEFLSIRKAKGEISFLTDIFVSHCKEHFGISLDMVIPEFPVLPKSIDIIKK